ncbi:MAG: hypothetical protein ACYTG0_06870 [Planctomycetota bacterium]
MKRTVLLRVFAFAAIGGWSCDGFDGSARAADRGVGSCGGVWAVGCLADAFCWSLPSGWCRDDYWPKPCPCIPCICTRGGCDDYRSKCAPGIWAPCVHGCCDDYRAKCSPSIFWPCRWPDEYRCPPGRCGYHGTPVPVARTPAPAAATRARVDPQ